MFNSSTDCLNKHNDKVDAWSTNPSAKNSSRVNEPINIFSIYDMLKLQCALSLTQHMCDSITKLWMTEI